MSPATRARRVVHQKAKGPISADVGLRVKQLREARGLTQSELAEGLFSKSLVSLIETGRTRMSLLTAERVAARLGVTVADILRPSPAKAEREIELALLRAEGELNAGHPEAALRAGEHLEAAATGVLRARAQRLHGRALNATSRSRDAVRILDAALRAFRAAGDRELAVRTLYDLAVAYGRLDQQGESLNLVLECERALGERQLVDRSFELAVLSYAAAKFVALGDFDAADLRAERAQAIAQDIGDPRALATLYASLANTREEQGDLEGALLYARRALDVHERLGADTAIGSAWNTLGWVYVRRGDFSRAQDALAKADGYAEKIGDGRLAAYVLQTRAELALARGHHAEALTHAHASIAHPAASERCRAVSRLVFAQALGKTDARLSEVTAALREATIALEPFGRKQLSRAYRAAFDLLTERGETKAANDAAKRALELTSPAIG
jgi:transcriptional regulator with XRE-family HTH domain